MKVAQTITSYIESIPRGKPFNAAVLSHLGTSANIRQILCRLTKQGIISRVSWGIFVRPESSKYVKQVLPTVDEMLTFIGQMTGATICVQGAEAVRMLRLSTQVPMKPIYYTTGRSRFFNIGTRRIQLKHVSPKKLVRPNTMVGLAILALWNMGKHNVNSNLLNRLEKSIEKKSFEEVLACTAQMPAWMANALYKYQQGKNVGTIH